VKVFFHPFLAAPMAGVTDEPFRARLRRNGCRALWTEMVSAAALVRGHRATLRMADPLDRDEGMVLQLFGAKPEELGRAARMVREMGWRRVDFNMGCPVRKVIRSGAGSAMLDDLGLAEACVRALREETNGILTVKLRTGAAADRPVCEEAGVRLEAAGADGLILHGRSRAQGYSGRADWSHVDGLARAVRLPVAGNGDIGSGAEAAARVAGHPVAAVMIGRAALHSPWIFRDAEAALEGRPPAAPPDAEEIAGDLALHFDELLALKGENAAVGEMKKFVAWAAKAMAGAAGYRCSVMAARRTEDMLAVIRNFGAPGGARVAA
jgi:nifR3 family TIM-barrel protein